MEGLINSVCQGSTDSTQSEDRDCCEQLIKEALVSKPVVLQKNLRFDPDLAESPSVDTTDSEQITSIKQKAVDVILQPKGTCKAGANITLWNSGLSKTFHAMLVSEYMKRARYHLKQ